MFNVLQFREEILTCAMKKLQLYSDAALELLTLTCAQESLGGTYIKQIEGPALGIFQMEPNTHEYLWATYLPKRSDLAYRILNSVHMSTKPPAELLEYNLLYAAMMARINYYRFSEPLPDAKDIKALAQYYKTNWNTVLGDATIDAAINAYNKFMEIKKGK